MYIVVRTLEIEKEHVDSYCDNFAKGSRKIDGLEKVELLRDARRDRAVQKVAIQFYWESKEKHKAWQVHPDHIAGHKNAPEKPSWILKSEMTSYDFVK